MRAGREHLRHGYKLSFEVLLWGDGRTAVCPVGPLAYSSVSSCCSLGFPRRRCWGKEGLRIKVHVIEGTPVGRGNWDKNVRRRPIKGVLSTSYHCGVLGFSPSGEALAASVENTFLNSSYLRGKGVGVFMHQLKKVVGWGFLLETFILQYFACLQSSKAGSGNKKTLLSSLGAGRCAQRWGEGVQGAHRQHCSYGLRLREVYSGDSNGRGGTQSHSLTLYITI